MEFILKIGNKEELFLPEKLREQLNLELGDKIIVGIINGSIIINKIDDLADLLLDTALTETQTPEEIEREIYEMQLEQLEI